MSLLLKNLIHHSKNGQPEKIDIYIEGNTIKRIGRNLNLKAKAKIDGREEKAVLPGLINCHAHSAMVLFRGYGDDLPLEKWLKEKIWPIEQRLTEDDIYWGTKLACLEMIKTGTTFFNDMYWYEKSEIEAVKEMGLRAVIGIIIADFDKRGQRERVNRLYQDLRSEKNDLIQFAIDPHSIYTVSKENLIWAKNFAKRHNLLLHIHLSETEKEVKDCKKRYKLRPAEFLDKIGLLNKKTILAHAIWLSNTEIEILAKRKCSVVYNPCSNLKLAAGEIFPYKRMKEARVNVCLGTDGPASNNNLDLFEEMKVGSLLQKHKEKDPTIAKAKEVLNWATINGGKALRINTGEIAVGKLADLILIDLNQVYFKPGYNFISDIVYSASGNCVSDVICNGKIIMRERKIEGEEKVKKKAKLRAKNLLVKG